MSDESIKLCLSYMKMLEKFKSIFSVSGYYEYFKEKSLRIYNGILNFFHHFKVLREANISLGKYHIKKGNLNDASIRFWITNKFFAPNDPENMYWWAWAEMLQKKYGSAIQKITNNTFDKVGLHKYLLNMSTMYEIPEEIYWQCEELIKNYKHLQYRADNINLHDHLEQKIIPFLPSASDDLNVDYFNVLEIHPDGELGARIANKLPEKYIFEALYYIHPYFETKELDSEKFVIYDDVLPINRGDFSKVPRKKYDLILSLNSLAYKANLQDNLRSIKDLLDQDGILILVLPASEKTKLVPSENRFAYAKEYLEENFNLAEYDSVSINTVNISENNKYFIIVAK